MWGGETTADELRRIADVVDKYKIPTVKVTGGQRIDLLGVKKEDLPGVWKDIGMPSGHAYAKALRTVKTCVGSEWCRFGTQDSTQMGKDLERALWRMYAPHKVKLAVCGCPRNCAEAGIKDVGVIGVDSGWEIYVAGNGGIKTEVAQFLVKVKTAAEVLEYSGAFLQLYREEGWYLERTVHYVSRVGLDHVKKQDPRRRRRPQGAVGAAAVRLDGEPDPWFEFDKAQRRPAPVRARCRRRVAEREREALHERLDGRSAASTTSRCWARAACSASKGCEVAVFRTGRRPGVRAARPLPAQGRPAVPGHRVRRQRGLPAAQLDHRPGRRLRQGARRRLHAAASPCSVEGGQVFLDAA